MYSTAALREVREVGPGLALRDPFAPLIAAVERIAKRLFEVTADWFGYGLHRMIAFLSSVIRPGNLPRFVPVLTAPIVLTLAAFVERSAARQYREVIESTIPAPHVERDSKGIGLVDLFTSSPGLISDPVEEVDACAHKVTGQRMR